MKRKVKNNHISPTRRKIKEYQNWLCYLEPGFKRCLVRKLTKEHFKAKCFGPPDLYVYTAVVGLPITA